MGWMHVRLGWVDGGQGGQWLVGWVVMGCEGLRARGGMQEVR